MTTVTILRQTARVLWANPPLYFLCAVGVFLPALLVLLMEPELPAGIASHIIQGAEATIMALVALPALAIATWRTACHRDGRPTTLRESFGPLLRNAPALMILSALLGLGWHLAGASSALPLPFPLDSILPIVAAVPLLRYSIALPIALLENRSASASLIASWQRLRGHWWTAAGIGLFYVAVPMALMLLLTPRIATYEAWTRLVIGVATYAVVNLLWTISMTCLYIHASPVAAHFAVDGDACPPLLEDLPPDATGQHQGEPHALADFGNVAPRE